MKDKATDLRKALRMIQDDVGMMRIYICSQYGSRGNKETNLELAKMFCMCLIEGGYTPICPHVFYHEVLNDEIPSQRATGLELGLHLCIVISKIKLMFLLAQMGLLATTI